jgi:RNA polymerase sigma-70 factor (ECF subfamily)
LVTAMSGGTKGEDLDFEDYRAYLRLLAQLHVERPLWGKVDLSGIVQQTMLEAHEAMLKAGPQQGGHLAAWLRRILANNLADEIRRLKAGKRNVIQERSLEAALDRSSSRLQSWIAADQSSPSEPVHRQEQSIRVAAALARLPDAQREALVMRHLRGWSLAEIAEHLGRTHAAVAGLLKRGLQQLRIELRDCE